MNIGPIIVGGFPHGIHAKDAKVARVSAESNQIVQGVAYIIEYGAAFTILMTLPSPLNSPSLHMCITA